MKIVKITNGAMAQNCYVLVNDKKEAILIDPGLDTKTILKYLKDNKLSPKIVLLTHGHFDHIYSAKAIKDMGAKIYITEVDGPKLMDSEINMGFIMNIKTEPVAPDGFLKEGEMEFLGEKFEIVFTPGHTSGGCIIIYKDNVFTGDTYFQEGVYGRTDLLDGNQELLNKSIKKITPILKGKVILSGHE